MFTILSGQISSKPLSFRDDRGYRPRLFLGILGTMGQLCSTLMGTPLRTTFANYESMLQNHEKHPNRVLVIGLQSRQFVWSLQNALKCSVWEPQNEKTLFITQALCMFPLSRSGWSTSGATFKISKAEVSN